MVVNEKKYKFIISKDRSYKGKYNVLKKEPTPLDKIKELFKFEKNQDGKVDSVKVKKKTSLLKTLGIISILFILVFGGLIYFILSNLTYDMYVPPYSEKDMGIDINPISYGMANINGHNIFTPYIMFDVQAHKLDEVEYFIEAADGPLYDTVYLLNSKREDGTRYDEFKNELREKMKLYGVPVNEIDLESLKNIPEGTSSVLVVPSGYFPVQFVNNETSVRKLSEKGMNVIYIGYDFNQGLLDEDKGRIFPSEYSVDAISNLLNLRSQSGTGIMGLNIKSNGISYTSVKREETTVNYVYNGIPVIKWVGDGTLIVLPESLDSGWNNGKDAASDVAKLITESVSLKSYGKHIALTVPLKKVVSENNTFNDILITDGKENIKESYVRLVVRGYTYDINGNKKFEVANSYYFHKENDVLGTLFNTRYALSKELSGSLTDVNSILNEKRERFPTPVPIFLNVYSSSGNVSLQTQFGTSYILPVEYNFKSQFNPKMSPRTYIIKLEDPSQIPYVFAQSVIQVPTIRIEPTNINWKDNIFYFRVVSDILGQSDQYTKSLEGTDVIIDGKITKKAIVVRSNNENLVEIRVPEGLEENKEHEFVFTAQEGLTFKGVSTIDRRFYEQWWFWLFLVVAVVPVVIGTVLRPKEKPIYSLDIPDFEVKKVNKIKIKKEIFINLFNSINKEYNWTFMPLKLKEIKNGFRKITYMGRPVIIGDYNLSIILEKLKMSGEVNNYLDLYVLSSWEKESGHDSKYLAMFRKVRDRFLNLAIPFTNINERNDCDIYVKSYRGEFKFVLGEGNNLYERIYKSLGSKEKVILVFKDEEDKMKFSENITMMGGGEGIKIAMINGKLIMINFNEIQSIVK